MPSSRTALTLRGLGWCADREPRFRLLPPARLDWKPSRNPHGQIATRRCPRRRYLPGRPSSQQSARVARPRCREAGPRQHGERGGEEVGGEEEIPGSALVHGDSRSFIGYWAGRVGLLKRD